MTSQGHPWTIYDRAIRAGHLPGAIAAAHNLRRPLVPDQGLRLLLLFLDCQPARYPRAAARWATSATLQAQSITVADLAGLAATLDQLASDPISAASDLADLAPTLGLPDLAAVLHERR